MHRIISGDVLRFAQHYHGPKFHAVLCDPPYELGFMGKSWDSRGVSFRAETWAAIRSLLVPGAHLLAFGGARTFHRIAVAIEDAGFEIRDTLGWLYGSGFPKSHNLHGAWQGYGTALKPAWEPVIVARNPLAGTVAQNAMEHGAGALNVDGGRVFTEEELRRAVAGWQTVYVGGGQKPVNAFDLHPEGISGRWPANIIHDGSDEIAEVMGDAQRFFYCAKASKRERDEGLDGFEKKERSDQSAWIRKCNVCGDTFCDPKTSMPHCGHDNFSWTEPSSRANHHPTVKPIALTEYLARLILPAAVVGERRILVPFAGSGSECIGAMLAGWETIVGVEREDEYARIARARMTASSDRHHRRINSDTAHF